MGGPRQGGQPAWPWRASTPVALPWADRSGWGPMDLEQTDATTSSLSRSLLRSAGPRLLRDILGPTLSFYAAWKLTGNLLAGIACGTAFSLAAYRHERRHGRPGMIARLTLAFVVVQATVGLLTGSAQAYLVQPAILGTLNGAAWLVSVAIGRPLASAFAGEVFPFDDETRASAEYRAVFARISLVFGLFFVGFAALQLLVLLAVGVDAYVGVRVVDALGILALIVWCVRFAVGRLGPALSLTPGG
jgi:intracellular septation protein A